MNTVTDTPLFVYAKNKTSRLVYTLDLVLKRWLGIPYDIITDSVKRPARGTFFISYGDLAPGGFSIPAAGLLDEQGIHPADPLAGRWGSIPVFYPESNPSYSLPFDIFSAVFYLVSRYEEYLPHTTDAYGRYPAAASILYRKGWLERALADEWVQAFSAILREHGVPADPGKFSFTASYDIDIAYSHRYKTLLRTTGATARDLIRMDFRNIGIRLQTLIRWKDDPYDCFRRLDQLHGFYRLHPLFFILAAGRTTPFDKNNSPEHPAMQKLIRHLDQEGTVGMHPSYYSGKESIYIREKRTLERITGHVVTQSRQHYLRMRLPDTYRMLSRHGITDDYSMGYGTHSGFRAGTGRAFPWYDLLSERETDLTIHPFCFMDATARFSEKLTAEAAGEKLDQLLRLHITLGSPMITIFHNFSLGTEPGWTGWPEMYSRFLERVQAAL